MCRRPITRMRWIRFFTIRDHLGVVHRKRTTTRSDWAVRVAVRKVENRIKRAWMVRHSRWIAAISFALITAAGAWVWFGNRHNVTFYDLPLWMSALLYPSGLVLFGWCYGLTDRVSLRARICPVCLYDLSGIEPSDDRFVKCPECGAAWRLPVSDDDIGRL